MALIVAGALFAVSFVFHPNDMAHPEVLGERAWPIVHFGIMISLIFASLGFVGLYQSTARATGALGLFGFSLHSLPPLH